MDINQGIGRVPSSSPTKPLCIRKQPSQVYVARSQQHLNNNNNPSKISSDPSYPPRTSSLRRYNDPDGSDRSSRREKSHSRQSSDNSSAVRSALSKAEGTSIFDTSIAGSPSTARSTVSSYKEHSFSGSSEIIGNFVPLDTADMAFPPPKTKTRAFPNTASGLSEAGRVINRYEFEPGTPYADEARQTTVIDFMEDNDALPSPNIRASHMKNSRSEGNAVYMTSKYTAPKVPRSKANGHAIQRSKPLPCFAPDRSPERHDRIPSPDISAYYPEVEESVPRARRGRSPSKIAIGHGYQYQGGNTFGIPSRRSPLDNSNQDLRSPTYLPPQSNVDRCTSKCSSPNRHLTRSPTKALDDVSDHDEYDGKVSNRDPFLSPTTSSPKKRSRSPMKKMFGEHGWLERSPDVLQVGKLPSKKSSLGRKEKISVMEKLRTKIEELAEKADLSPISKGPRSHEMHPKLSVLSVSLGPPEQARIYMEVELMLVHTANSFLMNQFSQGRMAMNSIKKTVDTWKARGRPIVIEFMYDQATQCDLITVNQHNLRFYGERAGDSVRINAMLYNWKQVANLMAIRTFCDADTIILKLLFDIEQILELLGAREPILLRLQQIRASANEMMRLARQKAQSNTGHQERTWNSQSSTDSSSRSQSMDNPYGGLQLVPESYME